MLAKDSRSKGRKVMEVVKVDEMVSLRPVRITWAPEWRERKVDKQLQNATVN